MKDVFNVPVLAGGAPKYQKDYLAIPIELAIDGSSAPDATATLSSTNSTRIRKFAGTVGNQDVFIPVLIPPDIKPATNKINFRVHAFFTEAALPSMAGVVFALKGVAISSGDLLSKALGSPAKVLAGNLSGSNSVVTWQPNYHFLGNAVTMRPTVPNGFIYDVEPTGALYGGAVEPAWPTTINGALVLDDTTYHLITAFADYGATIPGAVLVTSPLHGINWDGGSIAISGTTHYNGSFVPIEPDGDDDDGDHFCITAPWVSDDGSGKFHNAEDGLSCLCLGPNYPQNSLLVTDWSGDGTITDLSPVSTFMMLNFSRVQNDAEDTYQQKMGVAFVELRFPQEPAS